MKRRCGLWHRLVMPVVAWLLCLVGVCGQGTISFGNLNQVFDVDGKTPLAGPEFLAELYAAAPGESLEPISASITPFLAAAPGYFFNPTDVILPGVPIGGNAMLQVVAWRASDGPTFEAANHVGAHVGMSPVAVASLHFGLPMASIPRFSLQVVVPEPSVLSLGLMAGVWLMFWRQRRCCR